MEDLSLMDLKAIARDARENGDIVVGMASLSEKGKRELLEDTDSAPDVLIDLTEEYNGGDPEQTNRTWVVPAPPGGTIYTMSIEKEDDEVKGLELSTKEVIPRDVYKELFEYPVPEIGHGLPNLDKVAETLLNISASSIRVDRLDSKDYPELTQLPSVMVYHGTIKGTPSRIYRMRSQVPDVRKINLKGEYMGNSGWPIVDCLVILDENSRFQELVTRNGFPLVTLSTTITESVNKLKGQEPEKWRPDPVLAAGGEEIWAWVVDMIKRTQELDQKLFTEKNAE